MHSFRPLDGESISKHLEELDKPISKLSFRPLDGESISKLGLRMYMKGELTLGRFRPLDGESFSKLMLNDNTM